MNKGLRYSKAKRPLAIAGVIFLFMLVLPSLTNAQPPSKLYTIKNGKMYIQVSKQVEEASLDSFISQYALEDLALKDFIKTGFKDSLEKRGWDIAVNNNQSCVITKPLGAVDNIKDPGDKFRFAEEYENFRAEFPSVSSKVVVGNNRFKNKYPFAVNASVVTFFLKGNLNASRVMLAGSFNDWMPDKLAMKRTDSGWIADVKLTPGKYWYKFIVNGNWTIDHDNRISENDGHGNTNSVYYVTNIVFSLPAFTNARKVILSGSFNNWNERELEMTKTAKGWELPLYLADGTHTYRYIVDNKWYADPTNPDRLPNEFKEYNSVLRIGKPSVFRLVGYTYAQQVVLTGSFNKWRKDELFMKKTADGWELPYTLGPGNHEYRVIVDGKEIVNPQNVISIDNQNNKDAYLILDANYTFRLKGFPNAKKVYLAGDFNDWKPATLAMTRQGDEWVFSVHLTPGKHVYKFIVDGKWIIDPGNKLWEQNEYGTGNSVIWIEQH